MLAEKTARENEELERQLSAAPTPSAVGGGGRFSALGEAFGLGGGKSENKKRRFEEEAPKGVLFCALITSK